MMWSGDGMGWVGWIMMTAGMLVIVALVVVVVAICALIPGGGRDRSQAPGEPEQNDKSKPA